MCADARVSSAFQFGGQSRERLVRKVPASEIWPGRGLTLRVAGTLPHDGDNPVRAVLSTVRSWHRQ